jgi:hypothetical protein
MAKLTADQKRKRIYKLFLKYANKRVSNPRWDALWKAILAELYDHQ